jgi:hypothetical protein
MIEDSYYQWLKNPLANNIIEIMLDYVLSDGITYEADDDGVKEILDEFWEDTSNNWDIMQYSRFRDLFLYGELLLGQYTTKFTRKVKVYSAYPGCIASVRRDEINAERISQIELTLKNKQEKKWYDIIYYDEQSATYKGDYFFFQINKTTHQTRGLSDLFVSRDWLRLYDKSLYATMERVGLLLSFVYHITMKGAQEEDLRNKLKSIQKNPPQPGGVRVTNDAEDWKDITPNLQGRSYEDMYRLFKSQVIAGSRQPETFFGMGGDVNLATALSMNAPFYRKVKRRQKFCKYIIKTIFDYVLAKKMESGELSPKTDLTYKIIIPEPDKEIAQRLADTLLKFSQALTVLETNGYITGDTANSVVNMILNIMGIEQNADDMPVKKEGKEIIKEGLYDKVSKYMKKEGMKK